MQKAGTCAATGAGVLIRLWITVRGYPQFPMGPLHPVGDAGTVDSMKPPRLILPEDMELLGRDARDLAKLKNRGKLVKVRRAVYADAVEWKAMDQPSQYGLRAAAYHVRSKLPPVFCHATAALVWGLWLVGKPEESLHCITESATGGRSHDDVTCHIGSVTEGVVQCGELLLTDKLTTTMQLIASLTFERAVAACDSSLHEPLRRKVENTFTPPGVSSGIFEPSWKNDHPQGPPLLKAELMAAAEQLPSKAARNRAVAVIEFASGLSGSAGESLSRVRMARLGFVAPELQHKFVLRDGSAAFTDFWFEEQRRVGEFDGRAKYLRADWGNGLSLENRILKEKDREDQIRAQNVGVFRWTWDEMMNLRGFERLLRQAGIPQK